MNTSTKQGAMHPRALIAGPAGILAGVGLAVELALFMTSGWTPETFDDPAAALAFLQDSGTHLRAAVLVGTINLVFTTILIAGLAARLQATTPTRAATTLYFGLIGIGGHGLVPLGLWLGIPLFVELADHDYQVASNSWGGFAAFLSGAGGLGYLFLGLSMLVSGWAAVSKKALPVLLGWVGVVAGVASVVNVLAAETPVDAFASAAFLPALLFTIVFRIWAGYELWKGKAQQAPTRRTWKEPLETQRSTSERLYRG
jgi:uncharacterized protein DUF4386